MTDKKFWFAVMRDDDDNDWGCGSYDLNEAKRRANEYRENGNPDAYIAVISEDNIDDPICIDVIRDF